MFDEVNLFTSLRCVKRISAQVGLQLRHLETVNFLLPLRKIETKSRYVGRK